MAPPSQPKRQRLSHSPPSNNASSLEQLLESVLAIPDPSVPLDLSLERILESKVLESDKEKLVNVAMKIGSALVDAASRSSRKLATAHNSVVWPLPSELTVKMMSFLDTASLCYSSATCTTFSKCASKRLCYADVDLTRNWPNVRNSVVCTMIQRAGKNLRSLKLGTKSRFDSEGQPSKPPLTRTCLAVLSLDNGAFGSLLQKLCLYRIQYMDKKELVSVLSNCKCLKDFEIFGIHIDLDEILPAVSTHNTSVERLCFDYSEFAHPPVPNGSGWKGLIKNCKMLTSLSIRGCILYDCILEELIEGLFKLKYVDFSDSIGLEGTFLRNLGNGIGSGGDFLETLILRDCPFLKMIAICSFFVDILEGKWKALRFVDLTSDCRDFIECDVEILQTLKESRPEIRLLCKFHDGAHCSCMECVESGTISGTGTDASSSSGDEVSQNGDDDDQNLDDSSSSDDDEIAHTQNGDDDDETAKNGEDQNLDSSSDDDVC